jgi:predicted ATPase
MLDVHRRLHAVRQTRLKNRSGATKISGSNEILYELTPLQQVASDIAKDTLLFAFDEFQVREHLII